MKTPSALAFLCFLAGVHHVRAAQELPIERVVKLIAELKARVEQDGKNEQATYDSYACWCENTLERKSADITNGKELIDETETLIKKLKGEIASHGAEIQQLKKDIAQNAESAKEATSARDKEYGEYFKEKSETEQCIGALEAATKTLTGAGTKKGFLDTTTHQAQLLSIAGQVRRVLRSSMPQSISSSDLDVVKSFVAKPMDFFHANAMSAAQVGNNPFGDYAPQSTQIQGILKGMYDAFTADLEKDNVEEADSEKSFQSLMATKAEEKATLVATLEKQETDSATKTKRLSDSEVLLDDTAAQLATDEAFFADTKDACQAKASEWSVRTRLRVEELNGMATAMTILSSKSASATFKNSSSTFLQLASVNKHQSRSQMGQKAFVMLKRLAARSHNIEVAKLAVLAQTGGHFDQVIGSIDMMIRDLREEEQDDIVHRDLCENQQNANGNELADIGSAIEKTEAALKRMENTKKNLGDEISQLEKDIAATKKEQAELLKLRNSEVGEFRQALKDDADAIELMKQAIVTLEKFYKDNNIALEFAQKAPEYTKDPDKAPDTWSEPYGGRKSESGGILAILAMLVEDVEKEMAEARADDADAQAQYEKQNGALQLTLDSQGETKVSLETQKSDLEAKMRAYNKYKNAKGEDKAAEDDTNAALLTECAWVKSHFDTRAEKRKNEIQGLVEAKGFLAGVDAGEDNLAP